MIRILDQRKGCEITKFGDIPVGAVFAGKISSMDEGMFLRTQGGVIRLKNDALEGSGVFGYVAIRREELVSRYRSLDAQLIIK